MISAEYHYWELADYEQDQNIDVMLEQHVHFHYAPAHVKHRSKY